jgi:hypothetical protein
MHCLPTVEVIDPVLIEVSIAESFVGPTLLGSAIRFRTEVGAQWRGIVGSSHRRIQDYCLNQEHAALKRCTDHDVTFT